MRDTHIPGLLKHFEDPRINNRPEAFTQKDVLLAAQEIKKCRDDFLYAGKNYFWITSKERRDVLFEANESQDIIYDHLLQLKARGRPQRIQVLKARQIGCSTLIESIIAWKAMFFPNQNGLVVGDTTDRSTYLFNIMGHIFERLPWWMKPLVRTKKYEDGLHFANPDQKTPDADLGLNSRIIVQSAKDLSGVGTGYTLTCAHLSEYARWEETRAKEIISGEVLFALVESPETIAVLESTARGARRFAHKLWKSNVELGDMATWEPVFIPYFMERRNFMAPEKGWRPDVEEASLRERVKSEWMRCDSCNRIREQVPHKERIPGSTCQICKKGTMQSLILTDGQLCWIWSKKINAARQDEDALRELRQDMCSTAEEAFQSFGSQVFDDLCHTQVASTVRKPLSRGFFDQQGAFHGVKFWGQEAGHRECFQPTCKLDHSFDQCNINVWEWPIKGATYAAGVDVSSGRGQDYSTIVVNRVGQRGMPDVQVFSFRDNKTDVYTFADIVNVVGRMYNNAMLAIEYNYPSCADRVTMTHNYQNIYQWKVLDSATNVWTNRLHWVTNEKSKRRLWTIYISFLRQKLYDVRDQEIAHEMKEFQELAPGSERVGAAAGEHDDLLMAAMIAVVTAHEMDMDTGSITPIPLAQQVTLEGNFEFNCSRCKHKWTGQSHKSFSKCVECGSYLISIKRMNSEETENRVIFNYSPSTGVIAPGGDTPWPTAGAPQVEGAVDQERDQVYDPY